MTASRARTPRPLDPTDILARLSELGPPSEIRNHSPELAASALALDRVLLTSIRNGMLFADALRVSAGRSAQMLAMLREAPVALEYPLIEGEIMRRRQAQIVRPATADAGGPHAFGEILGWTEYAIAPVIVEGVVVGFFHGDRNAARALDESDAHGLASFAACFAIVYERTVLRQRLRAQRHEMRLAASWADARAAELGDRSITLDEDGDSDSDNTAPRTSAVGEDALRGLLTRRELEVLEHMVRGETNAGIARDLVLSAGTVKFHVRNILRKLHAANRAEATSRYLRLTLN